MPNSAACLMQLTVSLPPLASPIDLRAAGLRLHQECGEVGGARERRQRLAEHLAAGAGDEARGILLQRMAERIVGGDEEPGVAAFLHRRIDHAVRHRPGVVDEVEMVRSAIAAGDVGRCGAGEDRHLVLLLHQVGDRECRRGQRHIGDDIDALVVEPVARDGDRDVGLQLQVRLHDFRLDRRVVAHEVLDRHLRAEHRAKAGIGRIGAAPCR